MNLNIKTTKNILEIAQYISNLINNQLNLGKNVLFLVSGGSAISLEVEISKRIKKINPGNLVVTLVDERYGLINHLDSNWFNLKEGGFKIKDAKFIPMITGKDFSTTIKDVQRMLKEEISRADYKIGIFGIGIDGHTAGILPHTEAVNSNELAFAYETELYDRITITPKTILLLDEAIVYTMGDIKWPMIENLKNEIPTEEMPAQILKQVSLLTIFTDYNMING
jgi:6-phosphogluconolactonase/glucosamine-6-phosphate isomerase/deaminase